MNDTIHVSIVLYRNSYEQIAKVVGCVLRYESNVILTLVDNSPDDTLKPLEQLDARVNYIFNNANLGYGSGHNIAIKKSIENGYKYHLVLNPDVFFNEGTLENIASYMDEHADIGMLSPKILYPDGSVQHLCKLIPTPFDLFSRRFVNFGFGKSIVKRNNEKYELRFTGYDSIMDVPFLSGCFMFIRTEVLKEIGVFDDNIFMFLEDVDLCRRIHRKYKTVFYPLASIYHEYGRGAYHSKKILGYFIRSAIYYYNKWGWVLDSERKRINSQTLHTLKYKS